MTTLTAAQARVLGTMLRSGRCVGASATDEITGYVHTTAARSLVERNLAREETGATGRPVFVLTAEGRDVAIEGFAVAV